MKKTPLFALIVLGLASYASAGPLINSNETLETWQCSCEEKETRGPSLGKRGTTTFKAVTPVTRQDADDACANAFNRKSGFTSLVAYDCKFKAACQ